MRLLLSERVGKSGAVRTGAGLRTAGVQTLPVGYAPGFGNIATPDTVVTIPGSGTNGGKCMVGPFPPDRFNDPATGRATINLSASTGLTVAVVRVPRNA